MPSIEQKILAVVFAYSVGGFFLFAGFSNFKDTPTTIQKTKSYIGIVTAIQIKSRFDSKAGELKSCHIDLDNSFSFRVYLPNQDYYNLMNEIKIGDRINIHYSGLDTYQIEKGQKILYSFSDGMWQKNFFSIALLVLGIGSILVGRWYFSKDD